MHFIHPRRGIIGPKSWAKGKDQKVRKKCMLIYKKNNTHSYCQNMFDHDKGISKVKHG